MSHREEPARPARRRYLIDPQWQLSVTGVAVGTAGVISLLCLVASYYLTTDESIQLLSSGQLGILAIAINALYFALIATVFIVITMRFTHTVAGPALVIQRAVEALREGRFDSRLQLRKHDYLKGVAGSLHALSKDLRDRQFDEQQLLTELEEALARKDFGSAAKVAQALRDLTSITLAELRLESAA